MPYDFLEQSGWLRSLREDACIDSAGNFVPWYNYAVIDFLSHRLSPAMSVFEFGCGYSTLFYASKCHKAQSVETNMLWLKKIESIATDMQIDNANIAYVQKGFSTSINSFHEKFDIVAIDSIDRAKCCYSAYDSISDSGIIVLDNSERQRYAIIFDFLKHRDFKSITFSGLGPLKFKQSYTTIFYRPNNILQI